MSTTPKTIAELALAALGDRVEPNGNLRGGSEYLRWNVGDSIATLDGEFDAVELIAIGQHMLARGSGALPS